MKSNLYIFTVILIIMISSSCAKVEDCKSYDRNNYMHNVLINPDLESSFIFANDSLGNIQLNITRERISGAYTDTCAVGFSGTPCGCEQRIDLIMSDSKKRFEIKNSLHIGTPHNDDEDIWMHYRLRSTLSDSELMFTPNESEFSTFLDKRLSSLTIDGKSYSDCFIYDNGSPKYRDSTDVMDSLCIQKGEGMIALWIGENVWVREDLVK
ncbi:MAG: hypothetical protein RI562_03445 [Salibacter sp.]|uniref:hypothetical protein n=1 Tax=Salibacter sp. TaxID=2010995 RepID=UPI00286FF9CA|nr:hypothetical protein [Salibacter sp.]MDR9398091.1 hypothetical protein [Salibacter sp.]